MKLNKIFMAFAAMAVVGCSSDDLNVAAPEQAAEDSRLVELNPNFVLAGVGVEDTGTRTHWEQNATTKALQNKFLPIYDAGAAFTATLDADAELTAQAVGLCWLGTGAATSDVYTNYQFYHFGWLNKGEEKANIECDVLTNGSLYSDINMTGSGTPGAEADETTDFVIPAKSLKSGADNLNYNSGVYRTDNKAIFGGTYIVYYPFNEDFKDAGTIPATATTTFNNVSEQFDTPELGLATFRYSSPVTIEGGDQAADFGLYNLSSLVQLRVATPADDATLAGAKKIDQIVLYSAKEQLLKQANLAADKIVAGQKGEALYADKEGTKTITANFTAPVFLQKTNSTTPKPTSAYVTVLPTTVDDLVVLVHNSTDKTWARINMGKTVFEAGKAKRLDITVTKDDFKSEFIAVDEASLIKARDEARALPATLAKPATIEVIGDIELFATLADGTPNPNNPYDFATDPADPFITYTGDAIIVPEDVTLNVNTNIVSDVNVLGRSCCSGTQGGRLDVKGGTLNNVTLKETEAKTKNDNNNPALTYSVAATIAAGKTVNVEAGNVYVNAAVQHKGNINIAEGANLTVNAGGDLNFMGSTVVNGGTIEVKKNGKYDMTDANGNATATDGQRMTNNGKFIHNVDAGVGTAVQSMHQNGEYRCKVNKQDKLDDAFLQWTACSVIEMVDAGTNYDLGTAKNIPTKADGTEAYKHKGKYIDVEVNTTTPCTFTNPTADNQEINIGKLSVLQGGLGVDYVNTVGATTGKRTLTVNGDMVVKAGSTSGVTFSDSKKINIKQNLTLDGSWIYYKGNKVNEGGLAVTGDITVSGTGNFDASDPNALNITCANFYLKSGAQAQFGNRSGGTDKTMTVTGTIDNPATCTFDIKAAGSSTLLAWITCSELKVGGTFTGARPIVE